MLKQVRRVALAMGMATSAAVLLLAAGAAGAQTPAKGDTITMPDVRLLDGTVLTSADLQGKPLIIEYWASWCPFCARQNPYFESLYQKAKGSGLTVLSVSIDKKPEDAQAYMKAKNYTFPVAMETPELRQVFGKRRVIPKIFVITADGKVAEVIPGEMFEEDVLDLIKYAPGNAR